MQATSFGIKSTAQERPNAKIPRPGDVRCPGSGSSGHFSRCPCVKCMVFFNRLVSALTIE